MDINGIYFTKNITVFLRENKKKAGDFSLQMNFAIMNPLRKPGYLKKFDFEKIEFEVFFEILCENQDISFIIQKQ